jgi:hypothetical protein
MTQTTCFCPVSLRLSNRREWRLTLEFPVVIARATLSFGEMKYCRLAGNSDSSSERRERLCKNLALGVRQVHRLEGERSRETELLRLPR